MRDLSHLLPLALFAVVSTTTPGGATALAAASSAQIGFRRTVPLIAGIALGLASMAVGAALGLAALLLKSPGLALALKATGSIYLVWLAVKIARSGPPGSRQSLARPAGFLGGVWMLWPNPKGWAMTLSASATFASLASGPKQLALLLGLAFGISATLSLSLWCAVGRLAAQRLRTEGQWRVLNIVLALLLVASVTTMWT